MCNYKYGAVRTGTIMEYFVITMYSYMCAFYSSFQLLHYSVSQGGYLLLYT